MKIFDFREQGGGGGWGVRVPLLMYRYKGNGNPSLFVQGKLDQLIKSAKDSTRKKIIHLGFVNEHASFTKWRQPPNPDFTDQNTASRVTHLCALSQCL